MELINAENRRKFGDDYIRLLIKELRAARKISSGKLINSLDYRLKNESTMLEYIFEAEDYFKYVDEGRRAGSFPPIRDLARWASARGISKDAVWPIARSIYKFGIKPTNIYEKATSSLLNGQPFQELEDNITDNVENIVYEELKNIENQ